MELVIVEIVSLPQRDETNFCKFSDYEKKTAVSVKVITELILNTAVSSTFMLP
jgi:hypothetical protein